jgi:hypothetical protein
MLFRLFIALLAASLCAAAHAETETNISRIVLLRHAEKPPAGLGQLSCRGLRRALELPSVLFDLFGRPGKIIAPDPAHTKPDHGVNYAYIRPLATIEPAAIRFGLPVDVGLGFEEIDALRNELLQDTKQPAQIWVAWEHKVLVKMERALLADLGDPGQTVPDWDDADFDRVDVIEIRRAADGGQKASYRQLKQNIGKLPDSCPR